MNKSIKLGSLVLAGVVMVGCGKKDDPNAKPIDKTKAIEEAGKTPATMPTTMGTMMENGKEKAGDMMNGMKEKGGDMMKGAGDSMKKMGDEMKPSTTQPGT